MQVERIERNISTRNLSHSSLSKSFVSEGNRSFANAESPIKKQLD